MFGKMGDMGKQMKLMMKLMKDPNFQALMQNPKMKALLQDPEFIEAAKGGGDITKLKSNPKFSETLSDPEIIDLIKKVDFQSLL